VGFEGTLLLVSHDRALLNAAVTSTLVFEGEGRVGEYVGGYDDWLRQRPARTAAAESAKPKKAAPSGDKPPAKGSPGKLSYKDQRELQALPERIEPLEAAQAELHGRMADPAFYRENGSAVAQAKERLARVESELEQAYARWEVLEERRET